VGSGGSGRRSCGHERETRLARDPGSRAGLTWYAIPGRLPKAQYRQQQRQRREGAVVAARGTGGTGGTALSRRRPSNGCDGCDRIDEDDDDEGGDDVMMGDYPNK